MKHGYSKGGKLGVPYSKKAGCILNDLKSRITKFGDKSMYFKAGSVNDGATRSKNGPNGNIMGGRSGS